MALYLKPANDAAGGDPLAQAISVENAPRAGTFDKILCEEKLYSEGIHSLAYRFRNAEPFPHLVIDGLFDSVFLQETLDEFDTLSDYKWIYYDRPRELKRGSRPDVRLPPLAQAYFDTVYSGVFVRALSAITGIENLLTDPLLYGGGLHDIPPGGRFGVHVDFQKHPKNGLSTRLVVITYLNHDWCDDYGGQLELWKPDQSGCEVSISPVFGRTVIFLNSSGTPHGHPRPVNAPDGRRRRSLAVYYYTNGVDDGDAPENRTTVFADRSSRAEEIKWFFKRLTPPVLLDASWSAAQYARRIMRRRSAE